MTSFLDDPTDIDDNGGNKMDGIGLVRFSICYRAGFNRDEVGYFPFDHNDKATMPAAKQAAWKHITDNGIVGYNGSKSFPQLGILCEIPLDNHLSANENLTFNITNFVSEYESDARQLGDKGKLRQDQQVLVHGNMPYDTVLNSLREFPQVIGKFVWMKFGQEKNQYSVALGRMNVKDGVNYPKYPVYVIREIYANEEEARQAAGTGTEIKEGAFDDFGGAVTPPASGSKLSDLAISSGWTIENMLDQLPKLQSKLEVIKNTKDAEDNLMFTESQAIKMICAESSFAPEDFNLILSMVVEEPF